MKHWVFFGSIILGLPMLVSCQNLPEPCSILEKTIEAHGGEKNISKPRMGHLKGISKTSNGETTQLETFDLPKRWKRVTVQTVDGIKKTGFNLNTEGNYWEWEGEGEVKQMKNERLLISHFGFLPTLLALNDKKVKLSPLDQIKVQDQIAQGFRGERDGETVDCYFDKKTGLLVQLNWKWQPEPEKEFESQLVFADYKEFDGVKFPYRRTYYIKGGNFKDYVLLADFFVTELKLLEKIPNEVFSLPKNKK